jgi:hypothetical protein
MEFIKLGKNYLIKNSNGKVVDEKTKLELENKELVLKDITGCECQKEATKKIAKNKKRIKEITALTKGEDADDIIEETDSIKK